MVVFDQLVTGLNLPASFHDFILEPEKEDLFVEFANNAMVLPLIRARNDARVMGIRLQYCIDQLANPDYSSLIFVDEAGFEASHGRSMGRAFAGCLAF